MHRAAGVTTFGDISQLLSTAPRDVVEVLRITAVVRSVTSVLGCAAAERLRINGTFALRGLRHGLLWDGRDSSSEALAKVGRRVVVWGKLGVLRSYVALNAMLMRTLLAALWLFGQDISLT
jgi:hypothetical protein